MEFDSGSRSFFSVEPQKSYSSQIVIPGEIITDEHSFMRGHGTYIENEKILASVCGIVNRVGKHISVKPLNSRYTGEVGDVVIGRIVGVYSNQWVVSVNACLNAVLNLGAMSFDEETPRRRTMHDSFKMRNYFVENDMIVADVRSIFQDGSIALQISKRQGKLGVGILTRVPHMLIKKTKTPFSTLPCQVDIILANNGNVWITASRNSLEDEAADYQSPPTNDNIPKEIRENISRVHNSILILAQMSLPISTSQIMSVYSISKAYNAKEMLKPHLVNVIAQKLIG